METTFYIISFLAVAMVAFAAGYIWGYTHAKFRDNGKAND